MTPIEDLLDRVKEGHVRIVRLVLWVGLEIGLMLAWVTWVVRRR